MAAIPITKLKDIHHGEDIWIVASGPSAGFIDPHFFDNKIVVGINNIWKFIPVDYVVIKESNTAQEAIDGLQTVIASRNHAGSWRYQPTQLKGIWYTFEHLNNGIDEVDLSVIGTDLIVVSYSTITSAIHIAAYMGAANIILAGHDCGYLDGLENIQGYPPHARDGDFYRKEFLPHIEPQSLAVRERLKQVYGVRIYSLNPFLNFGLEGHKYAHA